MPTVAQIASIESWTAARWLPKLACDADWISPRRRETNLLSPRTALAFTMAAAIRTLGAPLDIACMAGKAFAEMDGLGLYDDARIDPRSRIFVGIDGEVVPVSVSAGGANVHQASGWFLGYGSVVERWRAGIADTGTKAA